MRIPLNENMVRGVVNELYDSMGVNKIKLSNAVAEKLGDYDGYLTKDEMKDALLSDRVYLSLKDYSNKNDMFDAIGSAFKSQVVAENIADKMDRSDGREDGAIQTKYGDKYTERSVADALATGSCVVGRELRDRGNAKAVGMVIELHQNKDGLKITMGQ